MFDHREDYHGTGHSTCEPQVFQIYFLWVVSAVVLLSRGFWCTKAWDFPIFSRKTPSLIFSVVSIFLRLNDNLMYINLSHDWVFLIWQLPLVSVGVCVYQQDWTLLCRWCGQSEVSSDPAVHMRVLVPVTCPVLRDSFLSPSKGIIVGLRLKYLF